jgi:hypothetical protein
MVSQPPGVIYAVQGNVYNRLSAMQKPLQPTYEHYTL